MISFSRRGLKCHFAALHRAYGAQHWWPAATPLEVAVGAILTQNTAWVNVERALASLRRAGKLSLQGLRSTPRRELAQLVRSSGYFRQKARSLHNFARFVARQYGGSLARMMKPKARPVEPENTGHLRRQLLALKGIGPETADAILLYAGGHPLFVVDAYARRIFERHGLFPARTSYDDIRSAVEQALAAMKPAAARDKRMGHRPSRMSRARRSPLARKLAEFHGLLVLAGKQHCFKNRPDCAHCPLKKFLPEDSRLRMQPGD
ncbi:MAG TPA: hypothetical protein VEJ00_02930 [Candidatus Acidoferrales bacterium]|nr:hypothetical protein [Candidatus Acidoferrales bacterium]